MQSSEQRRAAWPALAVCKAYGTRPTSPDCTHPLLSLSQSRLPAPSQGYGTATLLPSSHRSPSLEPRHNVLIHARPPRRPACHSSARPRRLHLRLLVLLDLTFRGRHRCDCDRQPCLLGRADRSDHLAPATQAEGARAGHGPRPPAPGAAARVRSN